MLSWLQVVVAETRLQAETSLTELPPEGLPLDLNSYARTLLGLDHIDPRVVADPGPPLESPLLHEREHPPGPFRRDWVEVMRLYLDIRMGAVKEVARAEHRGEEMEVPLAVLGRTREVGVKPGILYTDQ